MTSQKFFVYIVRTKTEALYTGVAIDPKKRVVEHNSGTHGAKCLRGQRPVTLVWSTPAPMMRSDALRVEKQIKKLTHEQKLKIVDYKPKPSLQPTVNKEIDHGLVVEGLTSNL